MCLDVDDDTYELIDSGSRRARKQHRCTECSRQIDPGETYHYWVIKDLEWGDGVRTEKMCAHCMATLDLGCALTGCHKAWWWGKIHDLDPDEGGFVGDIIVNHELSKSDRARMMATVRGRQALWRNSVGSLMPVPVVPTRQAVPA